MFPKLGKKGDNDPGGWITFRASFFPRTFSRQNTPIFSDLVCSAMLPNLKPANIWLEWLINHSWTSGPRPMTSCSTPRTKSHFKKRKESKRNEKNFFLGKRVFTNAHTHTQQVFFCDFLLSGIPFVDVNIEGYLYIIYTLRKSIVCRDVKKFRQPCLWST